MVTSNRDPTPPTPPPSTGLHLATAPKSSAAAAIPAPDTTTVTAMDIRADTANLVFFAAVRIEGARAIPALPRTAAGTANPGCPAEPASPA